MCFMQDFDFFDQIADDVRNYEDQGEIFLFNTTLTVV